MAYRAGMQGSKERHGWAGGVAGALGPTRLLTAFAAAAALLMMVHTTAYFISRYAFSYPLPATLEVVAIYYMVVLVFAALAALAKSERGFISMTMVVDWLPRRARASLRRVSDGVTALYVGTLAVAAFQKAMWATENREVLETAYAVFPVWPSRWIVCVGLLVVTVLVVMRLFRSRLHAPPFLIAAQGRPYSSTPEEGDDERFGTHQ